MKAFTLAFSYKYLQPFDFRIHDSMVLWFTSWIYFDTMTSQFLNLDVCITFMLNSYL